MSCTDNCKLASSVLLNKFMKGVFNSKPSLPKVRNTWDVNMLLQHLAKMSPPSSLDLKLLSLKLATMLILLSGQRGQTVHLLCVKDIENTSDKLILRFNSILKQTRPGAHLDEIILPCYPQTRLCVVRTYQEYVKRTRTLRPKGEQRLLITTVKPYRAISRDTLSRWLKTTLRNAGVDMSMFNTHSTRSASTSAAMAANIPIQTIIKTAGWSKDCTFRKFYLKPVRRHTSFAKSILNQN